MPTSNGPVCRLRMARSWEPFTVVGSTARSSAGSGSPGVETSAALTTDGIAAAETETVRAKTALSCGAMTPVKLAVTTGPKAAKVQPEPRPDTKPMPFGSVSTTVVAPVVGAVPSLRTTRVQAPGCPSTKAAACRLASASSGTPVTSLPSTDRSLVPSTSPWVSTLAALMTVGKAAGPTAAVRLSAAESPGAMLAAYWAVTTGPDTATVQPDPAAATKVRPAGSVSRTVVVPAVAVMPTLVTVRS